MKKNSNQIGLGDAVYIELIHSVKDIIIYLVDHFCNEQNRKDS